MTKVFAQAAMTKGFKTLGAETHGMAQRGGSVISHLRLGDVNSSLIRAGTAHLLLALEENEAYRNITFIAEGGKIYANAPSISFPRNEVKDYLDKIHVVSRSVPADTIASELGAPMSSNLALLGFHTAFDEGPVSYQELKTTIEKISPERFKGNNIQVFDAGYEQGIKQKKAA
jgi:indolepyruvate ferredoxin oxidoreductase beta subunit